LKKPVFDLDFSELAIKGRSAAGNIATRHSVRKIVLKDQGVSTLGAMDIWFDDAVLRLNADKRGQYLGAFKGDDRILAVFPSGAFRIMGFELSNHFDEKPVLLRKFDPERPLTAVFFDGEQGFHYVKRFVPEATGKVTPFIGEHPQSKLLMVSDAKYPRVKVSLAATPRKPQTEEEIELEPFIGIKSHKARGKRLAAAEVEAVEWLEPLVKDEPEPQAPQQESKPEENTATDRPDEEGSKQPPHPDVEKQIRLDLDI
jgi:topoisomerase IV subunit A